MEKVEVALAADDEIADHYDELPLWSAPFGQLILEHVPLRRGQTVVDIGAGTGFLTVELAQRCGSESRIIAVDPWDEAMAVLRQKIDYLRLPNVELVIADAAELALPDASVDVVVSNLGINNFDNAATVLSECHRVLRPGGRLLLSTNLVGHMAEFYDAYRQVLDQLGLDVEPLERHIDHRATIGSTAALLEAAGFVTSFVESSFRMRFADGTALLNHYFIRLGFLDGWKSIVPAEDADRVFSALEAELNRRPEISLTIPTACFDAVAQPFGQASQAEANISSTV
ncbi:MAG TPA: methyltransferase domain-containing protein [Kribbella sp.]